MENSEHDIELVYSINDLLIYSLEDLNNLILLFNSKKLSQRLFNSLTKHENIGFISILIKFVEILFEKAINNKSKELEKGSITNGKMLKSISNEVNYKKISRMYYEIFFDCISPLIDNFVNYENSVSVIAGLGFKRYMIK